MTNKTSLKLRPLADRVIVEPLEEDEKTASGLLLPETAKDKPQQGLIVAVGPGRFKRGRAAAPSRAAGFAHSPVSRSGRGVHVR